MNARRHVQTLIKNNGVKYDNEKFVLANGGQSHYFFDIKEAFATGVDLIALVEVLNELAHANGMDYNVVGGMELGAVPIAIAMSILAPAGCKWFTLRKQQKGRGTNKLIEGYAPTVYDNTLIVEDVVSTGKTILTTYDYLHNITNITGVIGIVDRSDGEMKYEAAKHGFKYAALFTSKDLL